MSQQAERVMELGKAAAEMQSKGEAIYQNYQLVKEILEEIKKAKKKYSWKEIKERVKGHRVVKGLKEKEGKVIVDI